MSPQGVGEPAVPAVPLPPQHGEGAWRFRPGDGIWDELHPSGNPSLVPLPSEPQDELHVLADRAGVAACLKERLAPEQSEGAGDHEVSTEAIPANATEQERPQILDRLEAGEWAARHPGGDHPASTDRARH